MIDEHARGLGEEDVDQLPAAQNDSHLGVGQVQIRHDGCDEDGEGGVDEAEGEVEEP